MPGAVLRFLVAAVLMIGLFAGAPAAAAHTALTATDPAADSTVTTGPTRVTATFNEELQPTFASMTVVGPDGNLWSAGEAEVRGNTVGVAVRPLGPAGRYTVNYRVTSDDGHVVSGAWSFTVPVPSTGEPGPAVPGANSGTSDSGSRMPWWPLAVGAVLLIAGALLWGQRRRRDQPR